MLIALLIIPFVVIAIGSGFGYEMEARLIGIMIFGLLPFFLTFCLIFGPEEFVVTKKSVLLSGRILAWLCTIYLYVTLAYPLCIDLYNISKNSIPVKEDIITYADRGSLSQIVFGHQNIGFDGGYYEEYSKMFDKKHYKIGQRVKIHYLPNSEFILKTEILDE